MQRLKNALRECLIAFVISFLFGIGISSCRSMEGTEHTPVSTLQRTASQKEPAKGNSYTPSPLPKPRALGVKLSDLDDTKVTFWHMWGSGKAAEGISALISEFNAHNEWGITVEGVDQGGYNALEDAMNAAILSGDVPEVVVGEPGTLRSWYGEDVIIDLGPYVGDDSVGLSAEDRLDFFQAAFENGLMADGTRVGIPLQQSAHVLFYNVTWAQELGFDSAPGTSAELKEQACAAAGMNDNDDDPDRDGTGGLVIYPGPSNVMSWIFAYGGGVLDEGGRDYDFKSEPVIEVAEYWKTLVDEGCAFIAGSYPHPDTSSRSLFSNRGALFIMGFTTDVGNQIEAFKSGNAPNDEWTLIPFVGPRGNKAVNVSVTSVAVANSTREQELAAWMFIEYLLSPETQTDWVPYSDDYHVRKSVGDKLVVYKSDHPHWERGLSLLDFAETEPALPSWNSIRWAVGDAFAEILQRSPEEISEILDDLNELAAELEALDN